MRSCTSSRNFLGSKIGIYIDLYAITNKAKLNLYFSDLVGHFFSKSKKRVWSTAVRGKQYLTLHMRISGYLHQHVHSLAKASSSDVTIAVAEPEMTESTFSAG